MAHIRTFIRLLTNENSFNEKTQKKGQETLKKHEMSFTYEALVCLGKQTAFNFPLE